MDKHLGDRPNRRICGLFCMALAALVVAAAAQQPADQPQGRFYDTTESVGWVTVPVVVRTPGRYVENLEAKDFRLYVDDRPVRIETFDTGADAAVSVVFLQDISGSMGTGGKLEGSKQAISFFLEQARPGDEFSLASFGADTVQVDIPFTQDVESAREAMASWEAYGTTAIQDAVAWLPDLTVGRESVKRAAILITDGLDNASTVAPDAARDLVRRAELPVFVLGLESGNAYQLNAASKKVFQLADMLNLLAVLSGGRYYPVSGPYDLKEACADVLDDLRHQYVLGFSTMGRGDGKYHKLRVELVREGQRKLAFRHGYRGGEPSVVAGRR